MLRKVIALINLGTTDLCIAILSETLIIMVTVVARRLIALAHDGLRAVAIAAAAARGPTVQIGPALLVALYRI